VQWSGRRAAWFGVAAVVLLLVLATVAILSAA
jgi:hypothetical protein